jgi:hypothetical protein
VWLALSALRKQDHAFPTAAVHWRVCRATIRYVTAADLAHVIIALFSGGGAWLLGREFVRQWFATKRTKIHEDAETMRLTIERTWPGANINIRSVDDTVNLSQQSIQKEVA